MTTAMTTVLVSALVSALVAAFVTLLVEYFAKPNLEARKERVLRRHRDAAARTQAVADLCKWLPGEAALAPDSEYEMSTSAKDGIREAVKVLLSTPLDITMRTKKPAVQVTARLAGFLDQRCERNTLNAEIAPAKQVAAALVEYYYAPSWLPLMRRRRLREVVRLGSLTGLYRAPSD